jgi:ParB-like chromosome segregation protein Spo0J
MVKVKLSTIKPNPNNPRIIKDEKFEKLVKSIKDFPKMMELRPMIINKDNIVLGGNMRLKALKELGYKEVPDEWVKRAEDLTEDEQRRFIIKDNVGFGEHDWEMLATEWDSDELSDWGLDFVGFDVDAEEYGEDFSLPDGDKAPFQQMTFTLADEQAEQIKNAIADIKATEEYKYCETLGNENSNGNALYLIIMQWAEQRR